MKALLDTHTLLFWLYEPDRLGKDAHRILRDRHSVLLWSIASSWEVSIKVSLGKLRLDGPVRDVIPMEILRNGIRLLPIEHHHVLAVADLPMIHGDPFDRLLVAQAQAEGVPLVSGDDHISAYGVQTIW